MHAESVLTLLLDMKQGMSGMLSALLDRSKLLTLYLSDRKLLETSTHSGQHMITVVCSAAALHVPTCLTIPATLACICAGFMLSNHALFKLYLSLQDERAYQEQTLQSEDDRESLDDEEERASKRNKLTEQVEAAGAQVKQLQVRLTTKVKQQSCLGGKVSRPQGQKVSTP